MKIGLKIRKSTEAHTWRNAKCNYTEMSFFTYQTGEN